MYNILNRSNFRLFILILTILVFSFLIGCGGAKKAMQIKGSDTMVNLGQAWTEEYMKLYPACTIAVNGGGSGTGVAALISGVTDIAQCSREMKGNEIKAAQKKGVNPLQLHVANDGIAKVF